MTLDIPNVFIQTSISQDKNDARIIIEIRGSLVDILLDISPEMYSEYVTHE